MTSFASLFKVMDTVCGTGTFLMCIALRVATQISQALTKPTPYYSTNYLKQPAQDRGLLRNDLVSRDTLKISQGQQK